ncbi:MAG TPA: 4-hydroxy-tetrahydrodipicolinate synthase [Spirochaetia bacterium]|nr:4-hydroxy-tetrahydrodipicolinate synthase [Spirochaetia bacterium]
MFQGVYTAIITPFTEEGKIDETSLRKLIDAQIAGGVAGVVPMGTTGESPTLNFQEHCQVITIVVDQVRGRVPVIAGTGSNATSEAIELTACAKEAGVTASLQVAPYYNKPTDDGFYKHFTAIADRVDLPMIVYNIPGRTGRNIDNAVMLELAAHKRIVAVKEASGNLNQMMDLIRAKPADFDVLSGDDNLTLPLIAVGGSGVVSVASNLVPDRMVAMVQLALNGKWDEARTAHYSLLPLFKAIFIETNPVPIKAALAMQGLCREIYRLPMCPMKKENRDALAAVLKDMKLI